MRGEYAALISSPPSAMELPPRARRIPSLRFSSCTMIGTTSACAENTLGIFAPHKPLWNYLRVRGEYTPTNPGAGKSLELPPRARRIRCRLSHSNRGVGTTSACAENTSGRRLRTRLTRNYLRVRGEYGSVTYDCGGTVELPPRARRIHDEDDGLPRYIGTTSACAENTHSIGL